MSLQQGRVNNGLCPQCGKPSAPYYYCVDHRVERSIGGLLNRMSKHGVAKKEKEGRHSVYSAGSRTLAETPEFKQVPMPLWNEGKGGDDKRLRPRLRGVPVNIEKVTIGLLEAAGSRGATLEEIELAWGQLRTSRKHETVAGDLAALIKAQQKRERKAAKLRKGQWL